MRTHFRCFCSGVFLLVQRLHLQPQASLSTQDELGETANSSNTAAEFRVHPRAETKPEQGQRHDHSKLCQGELLTDAVPVDTFGVLIRSYLPQTRRRNEDAVPWAGGEGDEGVRSQALLVRRVETQRVKVLKERKSHRSDTRKLWKRRE